MGPRSKLHTYRGDGIVVAWEAKRCIHAAECVRGLPGVFDPRRRPWVELGDTEAGRVAEVVSRCPTGALTWERPEQGPEAPTSVNEVRVAANGPLFLRGDVRLRDAAGGETAETRVALCRCGHSANKPYCDGSHREASFSDPGHLGEGRTSEPSHEGGPLTVTVAADGPLILTGDYRLQGADGDRRPCAKGALCRCGESGNRPFCDGSHKRVGFRPDG